MAKKTNNLTFRITLVLLTGTVALSVLAFGSELIFSEKYSNKTNCSDFGTQEKAQHAFDKDRGNLVIYRLGSLDSDNDGRACEENPKSAPLFWFAFLGLFGALSFVEFKKIGTLKNTKFFGKFVVPSLVLVYPMSFSVSQIRDRVLPRNTSVDLVFVLTFLVAYISTYFCAMHMKWCNESRKSVGGIDINLKY